MSTLTDYRCAKFRQQLHNNDLDLLFAESPVLTKAELKAAFQAIEDFWEDNRVSLKSDIDSAIGRSISNTLAKKLGKYWLQWKWGVE